MALPKRRKTCLKCSKRLTSRQSKFCSRGCNHEYKAEHGGSKDAGRPTKCTPKLVAKLIEAYQWGYNHTEAAQHAGIDRGTVADWIEKDKRFASKITHARTYPDRMAKQTIINSIIVDKNPISSRWWLERRQRDEFATRQEHEIAGPGGEPIETVVIYRPEKLPPGYWKQQQPPPQNEQIPPKNP